MGKNKKQSQKTAEMQERIKKEGFGQVFESLGHKEQSINHLQKTSSLTNEDFSAVEITCPKISKKLDSYDWEQKIRIWNRTIGEIYPNRYIHENTQEELLKCIPSIEEFFNCITVKAGLTPYQEKYFYRNSDDYFVIDVDEYKHINYLKIFNLLTDEILDTTVDDGYRVYFSTAPAYDKELLIQEIMKYPDSLDLFTKK